MPSLQIAYFRKQAGMTQAQLAKQLRITRPYLSAIENGHVELQEYMQDRIVRALNLSTTDINYLLGLRAISTRENRDRGIRLV